MRWFVEVTALSSSEPLERLTFEAPNWQGALSQARVDLADTAPLAMFTLELLPEGFRATNAFGNLVYRFYITEGTGE